MRVKWLGHSCFLVVTSKGVRLLTDPFNESVGYAPVSIDADYVTVSHEHFDHNAVESVKGAPVVMRGPGEHRFNDILIRGISTFHDAVQGAKRGRNTVFVIEADGISICHLGDLGHPLSPDHVKEIGKVDVLLIPVGGTYTINSAEAFRVTEALTPKIVIPMHFKTEALSLPIEGVEPFLNKVGGGIRAGGTTVEITQRDLAGPRKVYLLEYA